MKNRKKKISEIEFEIWNYKIFTIKVEIIEGDEWS